MGYETKAGLWEWGRLVGNREGKEEKGGSGKEGGRVRERRGEVDGRDRCGTLRTLPACMLLT